MINTREIVMAVVSAHTTNARIYEFLSERLISSLAKDRLQVELDEFSVQRLQYLETASALNKCRTLSDAIHEEQKKNLREEMLRNSHLRQLVHGCQRRLWNLQAAGQPVPTCPTEWIYQDYPRLLALKQDQETHPLTVLCELIFDRYNLTHDKFIMGLIHSFQIEEMESQTNSSSILTCVLSDSTSTVSNARNKIRASTADVERVAVTKLVIPDDPEVKRIHSATTHVDTSNEKADLDLPYPDIFTLHPDVSSDSFDLVASFELKPLQRSEKLCSTAPICQNKMFDQTQVQPTPDETPEFSTLDFSTSFPSDLSVESWDMAIQEYEVQAGTPSIFTATTGPRISVVSNYSASSEDRLVSTASAFQSIHDNSVQDAKKSASRLSVHPSDSDMSAENKSPASSPGSYLSQCDADYGVTSYAGNSRVMMRPRAPVKKADHTPDKRNVEYPVVGSDIPHGYANRKVRKQHVAKEIAVSTATADEIAMKRERILRELDEKRQRTRNLLRKHSEKAYRESSDYFEEKQRLKRKALNTTLYPKHATQSAKLVYPVVSATVSMTTPMSTVGQRCHRYNNPETIISDNMTNTKKRKLSSDQTCAVPAKVAVTETCHVAPPSSASIEKHGGLVLKLSKANTTWTSRRVVRTSRQRGS